MRDPNRPEPQVMKADVIRKMLTEGLSIADIARMTSSHYSYVYSLKQRMQKRRAQPRTGKGIPSKADKEAHSPLPPNPKTIQF